MRYVYSVRLKTDGGRFLATSRDVSEAITEGDTRDEALAEMGEALGAALAGYSLAGRELPRGSRPRGGEFAVPVKPLVAAELALREAMKEQGVSNVALAERLGISEGAVRRLVNPDHASRLDGVVAALGVLGCGLVVEDQKLVAA